MQIPGAEAQLVPGIRTTEGVWGLGAVLQGPGGSGGPLSCYSPAAAPTSGMTGSGTPSTTVMIPSVAWASTAA